MQMQPLLRDWGKTRSLTKLLWNLSWKKGYITIFDDRSKGWGIRDSLNLNFVKEMQALAKAGQQSQLSIIGVGQGLDAKHKDHLFNPFLRLSCEPVLLMTANDCDIRSDHFVNFRL